MKCENCGRKKATAWIHAKNVCDKCYDKLKNNGLKRMTLADFWRKWIK